MSRSYYAASTVDFGKHSNEHVLGELARQHGHNIELLQTNAWRAQIYLFRRIISLGALAGGHLFFEFAIPRMGKRVDVVLIYRGIIFVMEFKVGERGYPKHAADQVVDYGLDLKNFHAGSHHRPVVPVLVCTEASPKDNSIVSSDDKLYSPLFANSKNLESTIRSVVDAIGEPDFDAEEWENSAYLPTPTIVEAAQALYRGHHVEEITRSDSGAINLSRTAAEIGRVIDQSKRNGTKSICFITGVPGSGKTLAGLNIANERNNVERIVRIKAIMSGAKPLERAEAA